MSSDRRADAAGEQFAVDAVNSEVAERAARLRVAVKAAGGNAEVAKRASMPLSTLNRYVAGRDMKSSALVALAEAARVRLDWLAKGEGPMRAADLINAMNSMASETMAGSLRPPTIDAVALAKAMEIIDTLSAGAARAPDYLTRARRIATTYDLLTRAEAELDPLPMLPEAPPKR